MTGRQSSPEGKHQRLEPQEQSVHEPKDIYNERNDAPGVVPVSPQRISWR
jgi:hypothetical protein